jgi:hypothetical protein
MELESFLNLNASVKSSINYELLFFDEDLTDEERRIGMSGLFKGQVEMQIFEDVTNMIVDINKLKIPVLLSKEYSTERIKGFLSV